MSIRRLIGVGCWMWIGLLSVVFPLGPRFFWAQARTMACFE